MVPTALKGHRHRESAAQWQGASRQSQVQHISCASCYTKVRPSKASFRAKHIESTYEEDNQWTTERDNKQYRANHKHNPFQSELHKPAEASI
jgi:hypothetical protein